MKKWATSDQAINLLFGLRTIGQLEGYPCVTLIAALFNASEEEVLERVREHPPTDPRQIDLIPKLP